MATKLPTPLTLGTAYTMNSSHPIPVLGFGVYQTPAHLTTPSVLAALKCGYRHIDSARAYRNETPCADAMRSSGIPRSDIFFTSKVPPKDISYDGAKRSVEATFKEAGLEYVDLYLLHAPYGGKEGRVGAWKALSEAKREGRVRSIGVSNFGVHHLQELEDAIGGSGGVLEGIDVNQVELHPWLPRNDIVEWCQKRKVVLEAYCPIVRGQRAEEKVLKKIAGKHGKTWAQVLVRWSLQRGFVPLPKSVTPSRIEENADVFDFSLDEEDMKALDMPESYEPCAWDPTVSRD